MAAAARSARVIHPTQTPHVAGSRASSRAPRDPRKVNPRIRHPRPTPREGGETVRGARAPSSMPKGPCQRGGGALHTSR
eukprot:903047-Prymnesium_polylepis.1